MSSQRQQRVRNWVWWQSKLHHLRDMYAQMGLQPYKLKMRSLLLQKITTSRITQPTLPLLWVTDHEYAACNNKILLSLNNWQLIWLWWHLTDGVSFMLFCRVWQLISSCQEALLVSPKVSICYTSRTTCILVLIQLVLLTSHTLCHRNMRKDVGQFTSTTVILRL